MTLSRYLVPGLAVLAVVCTAGVATAQAVVPPAPSRPAAPPKPAAPTGGPVVPAPDSPDAQDLVFFSETRPLLVRLHIQVNGKPFPAAWDDFINKLFAYHDVDGDGVLTKKETERLLRGPSMVQLFGGQTQLFNFQPSFARPEELDTNKDGKITREEFVAYYRKAGGGALRAQQNPQGGTSGQMTTALFRLLDLNKDGKLSKDELAQAPFSLRKADADDDEMISADELLPARNNVFYQPVAVNSMGNDGLPDGSAFLVIVPGTPLARVTQQLLAHYDKDHNQKLSREEVGLDKEAFDALDGDHNDQLDAKELVKWVSRPPDLELIVQVGQPGADPKKASIFDPLVELNRVLSKKAPVDVYNPTGRKMPLASSVRKEGEALVVTLSDAQVELQRGTGNGQGNAYGVRQFYVQQFDQLDTDKKGYLEKKQFEQPQFRFLRPLFELADRDGDGKLTKMEFTAFLDLQTAGASAITYLKVTDQGRGLFELLDANGDNRLSVRELRTGWSRLAPWDRNSDGLLAENEVPRQFQLVVDQGEVTYPFQAAFFGAYSRAMRPQPGPRGPVWFRKMDRNNDGDVSFREWLGTEEEFRRIDTDGDGLISAEEAEKADAALKKDKGKVTAAPPAVPTKDRNRDKAPKP
jgi:Ca2+-binding EF-hand superfamily protein